MSSETTTNVNINEEKVMYFYGHTRAKDDYHREVFSNFYPATFQDEKRTYCCSEQYLMVHKADLFADKETADLIMAESDPHKIKALGRRVKNFTQETWDKNCLQIMIDGCYLKFSQNEKLRTSLLSTVGYELAEAAGNDKIWGIGIDRRTAQSVGKAGWKGTNLLGVALMAVRDRIMNERKQKASII